MKLQDAFDHQRQLQRNSFGYDFDRMTDEERVRFITWNTLAGTDEAHEALNETSWKPWAQGTWINVEELKKELVDEFHFFMNRCLAAGMDAEELLGRYFEKARINAARQAAGYDAVTTKCTLCGRALDDVGISSLNPLVCKVCGHE